MVIRLLVDHFRRHVERSALDGGEDVRVDGQVAREAEVAQLCDAIGIDLVWSYKAFFSFALHAHCN